MKTKKTHILGLILVLLTVLSTKSLQAASTDFVGEIVYEISYEEGIDAQILEVLPQQSTLLVKKKQTYSYTISPLGNQGMIYDHSKETSYALVDFFSTKLAIKKQKEHLLKDRATFKIKDFKLENERKKILGYTCQKVKVTVFIPKLNQDIEFTAFFTTELGNNEWINQADPIYYMVNGTLLEYEIQMGSVFMSLKAKEISPKKLNDNLFKIPKTHTIVTPEEAEKLLKKQ